MGTQTNTQDGDMGKYGGFALAQVKALFNIPKERENTERMNGNFNGRLQWVLDTGASYHMSSNVHAFTNLFKFPVEITIKGPSGTMGKVQEAGTINLDHGRIL